MVTLKVKKTRDESRDNFLEILRKLRDAQTLNDNSYPLYLELILSTLKSMCFSLCKVKSNKIFGLPSLSDDPWGLLHLTCQQTG